MMNGIINIYKEKGFTSFDVVAKLRGILKTRKIGHTGTLDPDAEGVLPVCIGKATKICELLTDKTKEYEAVMLLGRTTDTQDVTGETLTQQEVRCSAKEVEKAVLSFAGDYMQVPPMYSALKVDGRKLCDLARAGVTVERAARPVHIFSIEILSIELPRVRMRVCCSKGTYIRTLCQDVGEVLGCGACMESLLRTRVGEFALADAIKLSEVEAYVIAHRSDAAETEELQLPFLQAVDTVFLKYESATVDGQFRKYLYNGNRLRPEMFLEEHESMRMAPVRVYDDEGAFFGIYEYQAEKEDYKPLKVFK
ncbi:tRNA pseudouridine(55) synthase TruB [Roseburia hominis]|uniref:tRNA pseudouridine(55) synthase TruB n=1 Tax=Roseburia hominis TaxID=301301 RepID=UPI0024301AC5|nr:tRNA pseudouridine(55) synthase TruB [Roseburia hominis]